mmetsp:Transcript_44608/g.114774  ORF Transcript_44608/g.114774 Transcript_44608/m.114774 type:complete len:257 (-) Transcript_44608:182-952(-)
MYTKDCASFRILLSNTIAAYNTKLTVIPVVTSWEPSSFSNAAISFVAFPRKMGEMRLQTLDSPTKNQVMLARARFMVTSFQVPVEGQKYGLRTFSVCQKVKAEEYCESASACTAPPLAIRPSSTTFSRDSLALKRRSPSRNVTAEEMPARTRVGVKISFARGVWMKLSSVSLYNATSTKTTATRRAHPAAVTLGALHRAPSARPAKRTSRAIAISNQSKIDESTEYWPTSFDMASDRLKPKGLMNTRKLSTTSTTA